MIRRLGKLPPRVDARTLRLARYLTPELPPAPPAVYLTAGIASWPMMMNDSLGDCTCAAAGHLIQEWTSNAGRMFVPADADILAAYAAVGGYDPLDPASDNGAYELDVLKFWRKTGIAGHTIGAFAAIDEGNTEHIRQACWLMEGLYIGLALPTSAQGQSDAGQPWDDVGDSPGGWGGHAVPIVGYDSEGLTCVTWGALQRMTWAFWRAYCDESYACVSDDMLTGRGYTPAGLDIEALNRDLQHVKG